MKSPTKRQEKKEIVNSCSSVGALLLLSSLVVIAIAIFVQFRWMKSLPTSDVQQQRHQQTQSFVFWFQEHGGWTHPNITLSFSQELGHGLTTTTTTTADTTPTNNGGGMEDIIIISKPKKEILIRKGEMILKIPSSLVFTADSCLRSFQKIDRDAANDIASSIKRYLPDPLQQQDAILAIGLMMECCLGEAAQTSSDVHPYLEILPLDVPRLDTFSDWELDLLQDADLSTLARESARSLRQLWNDHIRQAVTRITAKRIATARRISTKGTNEMNSNSNDKCTCLTYQSFHRFNALVGSRAMILNLKKYLVPMADMINHRENNNGESEEQQQQQQFETFHKKHEDGSISVYADRDVAIGDDVFEEYGKLDNSLYLMAFGFIPTTTTNDDEGNPYHCAVIRSNCLPQSSLLLRNDPDLQQVAERIRPGLLDMMMMTMPNICVFQDGSLLDEEEMLFFLALINLPLLDDQRDKCLAAFQSGNSDHHLVPLCIQYENYRETIQRTIRQGAQCTLAHAATSLEEDLLLLNDLENQTPSPTRAILALRFRVFEKKLLLANII